MNEEFLGDRRKALEEAFFRNLEREQFERWRAEQKQADNLEVLKKVSGITDSKILDKLIELRISAETFAAMTLTPLIEVAWADGKMEEKEKQAILSAADQNGIQIGTPAYELLASWLKNRPAGELSTTWKAYIRELVRTMSKDEIEQLKLAVLSKARVVAEVAGGFLGIGSKVSKEEDRIVKDLERAFEQST